jgi:hypothetical protein
MGVGDMGNGTSVCNATAVCLNNGVCSGARPGCDCYLPVCACDCVHVGVLALYVTRPLTHRATATTATRARPTCACTARVRTRQADRACSVVRQRRCVIACGVCCVVAALRVCRDRTALAQVCDVTETCDGVSMLCPPDVLTSNGTVCRAASDVCDQTE